MNTDDMSGGDFGKVIKAIVVGMLIIAPLWFYLLLSGLGVFGENFTGTILYKVILAVLIVFMIIMLFIWQPFYFWRKLFNGSGTRDYVLKMGIPKSGIIKSTGKASKYPISIKGEPYHKIPVEIEVLDPFSPYTVNIEEYVPEDEMHRLRPGIEVTLKIDRDDKKNLYIDWERF